MIVDSNKKQMILQRLGCYDQVGVCVFCAQFFQVQEEYRPSYSTIVFQEKRAAYLENKRREEEYWDPLKMMEKDRANLEIRKNKTQALNNATNGNSSTLNAATNSSVDGNSAT